MVLDCGLAERSCLSWAPHFNSVDQLTQPSRATELVSLPFSRSCPARLVPGSFRTLPWRRNESLGVPRGVTFLEPIDTSASRLGRQSPSLGDQCDGRQRDPALRVKRSERGQGLEIPSTLKPSASPRAGCPDRDSPRHCGNTLRGRAVQTGSAVQRTSTRAGPRRPESRVRTVTAAGLSKCRGGLLEVPRAVRAGWTLLRGAWSRAWQGLLRRHGQVLRAVAAANRGRARLY